MARKKALSLPVSCRLNWVEVSTEYSIRRQCRLAGLSRSNFYYDPVPASEKNLLLMRLIDERYMNHPEYSQRQLQSHLNDNYTYRLTTITPSVRSGSFLCAVCGAKPLALLPLGGGINSSQVCRRPPSFESFRWLVPVWSNGGRGDRWQRRWSWRL